MAAFFAAIWYEAIYFSIRPLGEVWSTTFFIGAIALSLNSESKRSIILSAILACLTVAVRLNYITGIAVFILLTVPNLNRENKKLFLISFAATFAAIGIFEKLTLGQFYISYYNYYTLNQSFYLGGSFGSSLAIEYLLFLGFASYFICWIFLIAGCFFWKKNRILIAVVSIILLTHILLPAQKHLIDLRHIYIVIPLILTIGAISISEIIHKYRKIEFRKPVYILVTFFLTTLSAIGAFGCLPGQSNLYAEKTFDPSKETIFYSRPQLMAYKYLYEQDDLVAIYDISQKWFRSGAFYYLHRDVPLYFINCPPPSMDYVSHLITDYAIKDNPVLKLIKQFGDVRIYTRQNKFHNYKVDPLYSREMEQPGVDSYGT
jgi:hypothetical protein